MPAAATACMSLGTRTMPSRSEYSVCSRRWTNAGLPARAEGMDMLGQLCTRGVERVARALRGHEARPTKCGESTRGGSNAVAARPARNPPGPGGFAIGRRHSSLMYHDTHCSSFLAGSQVRHGRAHATRAELPWESYRLTGAKLC